MRHITRAAVLIAALAAGPMACAVPNSPPATSTQGLCTAGDGCSWTVAAVRSAQREWIRDELPGAVLTTEAGCHRVTVMSTPPRSATQCHVSVTYYGYEMVVVCDGFDDGEFSCDTGWD